MHYRSIDDLNHLVIRNLKRIPTDVDLVVGIPRSGLLAGVMISLYLNLPVTDLEGLGERRLLATGKRPLRHDREAIFTTARRILVVDDCISSGTEMSCAREKVTAWGYGDRTTFIALYAFPERTKPADFVFETVPRPMAFQWSCMHTPGLENQCVDMDGILCADALPHEDDDGPEYQRFLHDAKPLIVPTREIGWIVTCRLEKYRSQTEEWLQRHGVRYRHLIMMNYPDRATRERAREHAEYKAEAYTSSDAALFIESNPALANQIAAIAGRPVMCFETNEMYRPPTHERIDILEQRLSYFGRRLRRAPGKIVKLLRGS